MSILFLILKIIGILLLIILCLILLILFHPIFYQVEGEAEENISMQGYFWWLFQILRLEFRWEDQEFSLRLRIFGFSKNLGEEETEEDFTESARDEREFGIESFEEEEESVSEEKNPTETSVTEEEKNLSGKSLAEEYRSQKEDKTGEKKQDELPKVSDSSKKKKQKTKKNKKEKKTKKENGILDRFKEIRQEISDERNHQAVSHLWRELCYLLVHLKPKYVKADISFSAGDPALTGKVTGVLSLLPLIYRYDAHIYPDFLSEKFYVKGSLKMKGHIAVFHFVKILIRLFFDKNVKRLYYKFK